MGDNGKVSGNTGWIQFFPGISIVNRWIVVVSYCFDHPVLFISVAFPVVWHFVGVCLSTG